MAHSCEKYKMALSQPAGVALTSSFKFPHILPDACSRLQQIAQQLEYRLIRRRLENGATGWAQWLEEDHGHHLSEEEGQRDDSDDSPEDPPASKRPISLGSFALRHIAASEVDCSTSLSGVALAEPPADELRGDGADLDTSDDQKGTRRSEDVQVNLPTPSCSTQNLRFLQRKRWYSGLQFRIRESLARASTRSV
jgi:hypothetical protein